MLKNNCSSAAILILMAAIFTAPAPGAEFENGEGKSAKTLETLQAEIAALRVTDVPWREIAWQSCLLEGLKMSREQHKPLLLWVFIDRPIDDERC